MTANPVVPSIPAAFSAGSDHDWTQTHQLDFGDDSIVDPQLRLGTSSLADTPSRSDMATAPSSMLDFSFDSDSMGYFGQLLGDRDAASGSAVDPNDTVGSAAASSPTTSRTADTSSSTTSVGSSHGAPVAKGKKHSMTDDGIKADDGPPTAKRKASTRKAKPQPKPSQQQQHQQSATPAPTLQSQTAGRRNKCLERNRVAASKCRQKKKEWVHDLEDAKDKLEVQHLALMSEMCRLQEEVTMIKELLTAHANCNDPKIANWIGDEAVRFVQRSAEPIGSRKQSTVDSFSPLRSRNGSVVQASPAGSTDHNMFSSAHHNSNRNNSINYDFMPDELFNDDTL